MLDLEFRLTSSFIKIITCREVINTGLIEFFDSTRPMDFHIQIKQEQVYKIN